jgi:hypothetical protein
MASRARRQMRSDAIRVLDRLYQSGINFAIYACWGEGLTVQLGNCEMGVTPAISTVSTVEQAALWLDEQARKHFPLSAYALGEEISPTKGQWATEPGHCKSAAESRTVH